MALITRREAARRLGMEPATLAVWDRKYPDRLRPIKYPNRRVMYQESEIERFLGECQSRRVGNAV